MEEREFEDRLKRLFEGGVSQGDEGFRDALLQRCLTIVGADDEGRPIDDEALDLLAAAGDGPFFDPNVPPRYDFTEPTGSKGLLV